jgi:hypothetical protein
LLLELLSLLELFLELELLLELEFVPASGWVSRYSCASFSISAIAALSSSESPSSTRVHALVGTHNIDADRASDNKTAKNFLFFTVNRSLFGKF